MPVYDLTLRDFLKYVTTPDKESEDNSNSKQTNLFSFDERIEVLKRIHDGLVFMNKTLAKPHRDLKPRSSFITKLKKSEYNVYCIYLFFVETKLSNILINVDKNGGKKMKWKNSDPKSVVITDIQILENMSVLGTAGWAPPEQYLGQFKDRFVIK